MTKKELIEKLEKYPDDSKIILISYQNMGYTVYTNYEEASSVFWVKSEPDKIGIAIT